MKSVNYLQIIISNFTINITNLPSSNNTSYTITLIINDKYYASSLKINGGASQTIYYAGGSSNIIIPSSTNTIIQTFTLIYTTSLVKIISSVTPYF